MHNRCLLQLLLVLSSLVLSKAHDLMGSGVSCVRSTPAHDGQTRVTFLREDAAGARSLYLTLWFDDGRLVTCEVNPSPLDTERYLALCDESSTLRQETEQRFNISVLLAPDAPCALGSSDAQKFAKHLRSDETEGKIRRRRGVIFPGTLWCGTGSRARGYEELGMFEDADRCCREHDQCHHIIPSFTMNYGIFNSRFYTVSHCDCDRRFRQCLLSVNDTIASMVGYSFFSILQVPCFELIQQKRCTQMYWWGMCKAANVAPYAVLKTPLPFNTSDVTTGKHRDNIDNITQIEGQQVTESPKISTKSPQSDHRCRTRDPPRGDTFYTRKKKGKGCKRRRKLSKEAPMHISKVHNSTTSTEMSVLNASESSTYVPNQKRVGKKNSPRKGKSSSAKQNSRVPLNVTTTPYPQATSTMQRTLFLTSTQAIRTPRASTTGTKSKQKKPKQRPCCGFKSLLRGDAFQPHCKRCKNLEKPSNSTTVTPSTTKLQKKSQENLLLQKTTEIDKQDTLKNLWSRDTSEKPKQASFEDGEPGKLKNSHLVWNITTQKPMGGTKAPTAPVQGGLTDNHLLCGSLKHLDECKYKILPLEKKYDLLNVDLKTAYHCDCTSRLALQIKAFKQPGVLPALLMDFVSPNCFKLPKRKKCQGKKSCSGGFTKASDLLRALKKIEGKDTAVVRNDRKRGAPVRLSKRCLRLQRGADIMAQLTRL
ncbi:group 3 secretory phospholipase A2-like [Cheilinus undulatus]|uniref:group 3 secretory phospholipase A2-like n=1 Tax=Cheilinus undulatus TaxID=241271 RepID=UPI001BD4F451|nr:group 3 secretory phospholipase A2-like [Cheilinus undulatus]